MEKIRILVACWPFRRKLKSHEKTCATDTRRASRWILCIRSEGESDCGFIIIHLLLLPFFVYVRLFFYYKRSSKKMHRHAVDALNFPLSISFILSKWDFHAWSNKFKFIFDSSLALQIYEIVPLPTSQKKQKHQ